NIQAAYADSLFDKAERTSDVTDKRSIYDEIASSPTIDRARRKRAAERLAELSVPAVNVADLPSSRPPPPPPPVASAPPPGEVEAPLPSSLPQPTAKPVKAAVSNPAAATPAAPTRSAAPHNPNPRPTSAPKSATPSLVRDNPY